MEKKIETYCSFKCPRCRQEVRVRNPSSGSFREIRCPYCNLKMEIYFYSFDCWSISCDLGLDPLKTKYETGFIGGIPLEARI